MSGIKKLYEALSSLLPGKVHIPSSPAYQQNISTYFTAQARKPRPSFLLTPNNSDDVGIIMKTLHAYPDVKFAVRGGGHNLNEGFANIDGGVTISLCALNNIVVSGDQNEVTVGGGAIWSEVYAALDALGLSTSGGRVPTVGVGGLCLGGGISYFSGRHGFVCDNIISYSLVLGDSSTVHVSQTENSDLFRALKGGGANFGIVTAFSIRTFPQAAFWGGCVVTPFSSLPGQLDAFIRLMENYDPFAAIIMSLAWNKARDSFSIFTNLEDTKEGVVKPEILKPFVDVEGKMLDTMAVRTVFENLGAFEKMGFVPAGLRRQFATTTIKARREALDELVRIWEESLNDVKSVEGVNWSMSIQPFPVEYSSRSEKVGGNVLGLCKEDGSMILVLFTYSQDREEDDDIVTAAAKKLIGNVDEKMEAIGCRSRFKYMNYAAGWQNPFLGYGEANMKFLEEVAGKYDPDGVFQTRSPGGFKISR